MNDNGKSWAEALLISLLINLAVVGVVALWMWLIDR